MKVYIDSNLHHHIEQGGEDMHDTCYDWIRVCQDCEDPCQDDPNWTRVAACGWAKERQERRG